MPILEVQNVTRRVAGSDKPLLVDVSLSIDRGDRIGLAGSSGSGKTSLLRAIACLDPIASGQVLFQGQAVRQQPQFRRQVVYLHQRPAMISGSVRDNFRLPFTLLNSTSEYNEQQLVAWINDLGKSPELLDQAADTLSGGEQQLIALMRAIQIAPQVLLLDEPSASLDSESAEKFERLVRLWLAGSDERAFIWTSHDESQLARMTTRIVTMANGQVQS